MHDYHRWTDEYCGVVVVIALISSDDCGHVTVIRFTRRVSMLSMTFALTTNLDIADNESKDQTQPIGVNINTLPVTRSY